MQRRFRPANASAGTQPYASTLPDLIYKIAYIGDTIPQSRIDDLIGPRPQPDFDDYGNQRTIHNAGLPHDRFGETEAPRWDGKNPATTMKT